MDTDAARPQTKKDLLVEKILPSLEPEYCRRLAAGLLTGRVEIPARWLTREQRTFIDLPDFAVLDEAAVATGGVLVADVFRFCTLVHRMIDEVSSGHALDPAERGRRHSEGATPVAEAILGKCARWPSADPRRLGRRARSAAQRAVRETTRPNRPPAGARTPDPAASRAVQWVPISAADRGVLLLRPDSVPADDRDLAERERAQATSDNDALHRHVRYSWHAVAQGVVRLMVAVVAGLGAVVAVAILFVALFAGIRLVEPDLSVQQDLRIAETAIVTALGFTGFGAAGLLVRRKGRARPDPSDRSGAGG